MIPPQLFMDVNTRPNEQTFHGRKLFRPGCAAWRDQERMFLGCPRFGNRSLHRDMPQCDLRFRDSGSARMSGEVAFCAVGKRLVLSAFMRVCAEPMVHLPIAGLCSAHMDACVQQRRT